MFEVNLTNYTGPLDVLLRLIEDKKMPIHEISLVHVTDAFLQYVRQYAKQRPAVSQITYYLVVAATLVLMKSRSLIPNLPLSADEEQSIEELELQLKLLKLFKDGGKNINAIWDQNPLFLRSRCVQIPVFAPDARISPEFLQTAFQNALHQIPKVETLTKAQPIRQVVHLHDVMSAIDEKIKTGTSFTFLDFTNQLFARFKDRLDSATQKSAVVVSFLALLEMVKGGTLTATQDGETILVAPTEASSI